MPANDAFASAVTLSPSGGTLTTSNLTATLEPAEQPIYDGVGGASIWFKLTPTQSSVVIINTDGSDFDTVLGIWTGTTLGSLTLVADDDESGAMSVPGTPGYRTSALQFSADAGTTYWVEVDGYEPSNPEAPYGRGTVVLNWQPLILRGGDNLVAAYELVGNSGGPVYGNCDGATTEPGEWGPSTSGLEEVRPHTRWFKFAGAQRGVFTLFVSRLDTQTINYAIYRPTNFPAAPAPGLLQELTSSSATGAGETWNQVFYNPEFGPLWIQTGTDAEPGGDFSLRWDLQTISDDMRWIAN